MTEARYLGLTANELAKVASDLDAENAKLRELVRRLLTEYRYMRARPRRVYLEHEKRTRAIKNTVRELGIET